MRTITGYFIVAMVAIIIIYDFYAIAVGGKDASISQYLIDWSYDYPISAFLMGVVMGHLYWRMPNKDKKDE